MGNVTLVDFLIYFIHLIWYFSGLFSELSLLVLSGSLFLLVGFGIPTRIFTSILTIGGILMILFPFQPQYDSPQYYENVNAHLYQILEYQLYRQNQPPTIGVNYTKEIGRKKVEEGKAILQISFDDTIVENEEVSTITERLSANEIFSEFLNIENVKVEKIGPTKSFQNDEIVKISKDANCLINEIITNIQVKNIKNDDLEMVKAYEDNSLNSIDKIENIELSDISSIPNNEIVSGNSSYLNEINSLSRDTIEKIEKVISIIEPDFTWETSDDRLDNLNSREPSEEIEEFLSVIDTSDIDDDIL